MHAGGDSLSALLSEMSVRPPGGKPSAGHTGDAAAGLSDDSTPAHDLGVARKNEVLVQLPGVVQWHAEFVRHVLPLRLSVEHLWSGIGKTHIIKRCCALDILQVL